MNPSLHRRALLLAGAGALAPAWSQAAPVRILVGAPAGAAIDPRTGDFRWTPEGSIPAGTYPFKVRVTDRDTGSFDEATVSVKALPAGIIGKDLVVFGEPNSTAVVDATNPADAAAGTIRKEFALSIGENSVHGSDGPDTAAVEIAYFFSGLELVG